MAINYDTLASSYDNHRRGGGPYINRLLELAIESNAQDILELGAGTGNNTETFLQRHPCPRFFALERSLRMLEKGRGKPLPAHWLQGDAEHLPFASASQDFIFSVYMLHHILDLDRLMSECFRVLHSGCAVFVTTTHDYIRRHPMNAYFPSFSHVDTSRFQDLPEVEASMHSAGFQHVQTEICRAAPAPIDAQYVEKVAGQFISTYALIPKGEFASGLARLQSDVAERGKLPTPIIWESAIIWGRK
ncbi:MAG: methyltransferase domain-containing protein [Candidatus Hydrogenedentes bacterium]|nr:methyltransferase domain-containing protein [Candidatus Hydrogenedentota bacterium]